MENTENHTKNREHSEEVYIHVIEFPEKEVKKVWGKNNISRDNNWKI